MNIVEKIPPPPPGAFPRKWLEQKLPNKRSIRKASEMFTDFLFSPPRVRQNLQLFTVER